jgi:hypothetical protein
MPEPLRNIGVTPFGVILAGIMFLILAVIRRYQDQSGNRTDAYVAPVHDMLVHLTNRVESIAEHEDFDVVMSALRRLDEKISNLSRATKMYGKPLVDVATRMQEAANHLSEIEGSLDSVVEKVESSSRRLGEDLSKLIGATSHDETIPIEQFEQLVVSTRHSANLLAQLKKEFESAPKPTTEPMDSLLTTVDSIRKQVAGIATSVHTLESRPPAERPERSQPASKPRAAAKEVPTESAAPPPADDAHDASSAPSAPTASTEADQPTKPGQGGLAHSIAGERKTKGKNVLGAIAKLKQMRN